MKPNLLWGGAEERGCWNRFWHGRAAEEMDSSDGSALSLFIWNAKNGLFLGSRKEVNSIFGLNSQHYRRGEGRRCVWIKD